MANLSKQLQELADADKKETPAEIHQILSNATKTLKSSGIEGKALKVGAQAPDFTLSNQSGEDRNLNALLNQGALVVNFYRGGW